LDYDINADRFLKIVAQIAHSCNLSIRIGIVSFMANIQTSSNTVADEDENDEETRIGAFEIQIIYKSKSNELAIENIHSKLVSRKWPSKSVLEKRFRSFVSKNNIPSFMRPQFVSTAATIKNFGRDGVDSYPIGFVFINF
jgi:hypothetical protein